MLFVLDLGVGHVVQQPALVLSTGLEPLVQAEQCNKIQFIIISVLGTLFQHTIPMENL
jgi:hypothetical protein